VPHGMDPLFGHAIPAAQIAAVRYREAQVNNVTSESVPQETPLFQQMKFSLQSNILPAVAASTHDDDKKHS